MVGADFDGQRLLIFRDNTIRFSEGANGTGYVNQSIRSINAFSAPGAGELLSLSVALSLSCFLSWHRISVGLSYHRGLFLWYSEPVAPEERRVGGSSKAARAADPGLAMISPTS